MNNKVHIFLRLSCWKFWFSHSPVLFFTSTSVFVIIWQIFWICLVKMIFILPFHQYIKMIYQNEMILMFVYFILMRTISLHGCIKESNMVFHALTFARSRGRWWKPRLEAEVFNTHQGTWRMLMHWKTMFDRYYLKTENICYISRYFLHYFVSLLHRCLANVISTDCARSRAGSTHLIEVLNLIYETIQWKHI